MAMTYAEALSQLADRLFRPAPGTNQLVTQRRWLNEGALDVTRRAECNLTISSVPVLANTQSYVAPADMVRVHRAEWKAGTDSRITAVTYRDWNSMDEIWFQSQGTAAGDPSYFTLWGRVPTVTLLLYPIPSRAGTLKVFYYALAAKRAIAGTDDALALDVPEGWEDLVLDYAEYRSLRQDRDPRWQEARSAYEANLEALMLATRRLSDQPGMIVSDVHPTLPQWLYAWD